MSIEGTLERTSGTQCDPAIWWQVAETASDIMYLADTAGIILEANPALCHVLRKTHSDIVGKRVTDHLHPDDIGIAHRIFRSIVSRRMSERSTRSFHVPGQETRTFELIEAPILRDGEVRAIAGIGREITEEVKLEHKLWDTAEARQTSVEFALRTSLGLVKGYVGALEHFEGLSEDHRSRYLRVVQEEVDYLAKTVEDILDVRRYEQLEADFRYDVVNLRDCIDLVVKHFASEATRRDIQIHVEIPSNLAPYYGPQEALLRVLINLVQNAIHHTLHNGHIWLIAQEHDAYFEISIKDNGVGIPESELPYIFDKYYRGSGNAATPGAGVGLGLAIVRTLVEALGGKVFVSSQVGSGSVFRVAIPRRTMGISELEDELAGLDTKSQLINLSDGGN